MPQAKIWYNQNIPITSPKIVLPYLFLSLSLYSPNSVGQTSCILVFKDLLNGLQCLNPSAMALLGGWLVWTSRGRDLSSGPGCWNPIANPIFLLCGRLLVCNAKKATRSSKFKGPFQLNRFAQKLSELYGIQNTLNKWWDALHLISTT